MPAFFWRYLNLNFNEIRMLFNIYTTGFEGNTALRNNAAYKQENSLWNCRHIYGIHTSVRFYNEYLCRFGKLTGFAAQIDDVAAKH